MTQEIIFFTLQGMLTKSLQRSSFIDSLFLEAIVIAQCESSAVCCSPRLHNLGSAGTVADVVFRECKEGI